MHTRRMDRRAPIVIHEEMEGPGLLEIALRAAGFDPVQRFRRLEPGDATAPLVVVMGGPMAVYEANRHPFLAGELAMLRARLSQGRPSLGICLGAQLLAAAAGSEVRPGESGFELGVFPLSLTAEAASDPVFSEIPSPVSFAHWHRDQFDAVPGAVRLAFTERYSEQGFRLANSYALQFHPELDAATFESWLRASPADVEQAGRSLPEIIETDLPLLKAWQPTAERLLERLARHFAEICFRLDGTQAAPGGRDAPLIGDGNG
jgi:GMP synthase (glutamine-hydrolysing)